MSFGTVQACLSIPKRRHHPIGNSYGYSARCVNLRTLKGADEGRLIPAMASKIVAASPQDSLQQLDEISPKDVRGVANQEITNAGEGDGPKCLVRLTFRRCRLRRRKMHEKSVRACAQGLRKRHPARVDCRPGDHDGCQVRICVVHMALQFYARPFTAVEVHFRRFAHERARAAADLPRSAEWPICSPGPPEVRQPF